MNMKALKERKNELIAEAEAILNVAETEVRGLNDSENTEYEAKIAEINKIEEEIRGIMESAKGAEVIETKIEGEKKMENVMETEVRGLEQYMRGQVGDELRALSTSTTGAVVPTHLYGEVIKKLEEVAPLFSMVPKLTPTAGVLEILKENEIGNAAFVGEATNLNLNDYSFEKVKLEQHRAGSAVELSQHLINDSGIDIVGYTKDILYRRLGYALDRCMVNGNGTSQFEGLVNAKADSKVVAGKLGEVSIDDFMNVLNAMHPELQTNAVWVMSRELFNAVALLKDSTGNFYMTRQLNVVDNKPQYKLLGLPIYINDAVDASITEASKKICYLVNFAEAYKGMIKKAIELKQISGDTANALKGTQTFTLDMYADCKIVRNEAIKFLETPVSRSASK